MKTELKLKTYLPFGKLSHRKFLRGSLNLKELNLIAENLLVTTSKEALDNKFIDKIIHEDDYRKVT